MTRGLVALGLGLAVWGFSPAATLAARPAVVSAVLAGSHNGRLQVEIRGSEPLNYLLVEGVEPFRVSLLFLNAVFAFPPEERDLPGPGLRKVQTAVLEREGSRLGRLDLTFGERVPYRVIREGTRVLVRVDIPAPAQGFVLGGAQRQPVARAQPAPAPAPRSVTAVPLILKLMPEIAGQEVRVLVEADGPLTHKSFMLQNPLQIVVDFERALLSAADNTVEVGDSLLQRIRSSQSGPTTVRVTLDLTRITPYWIEAQPEGVVIHLGTAGRP